MRVKINGFCHRRFWPLREAFKTNFAEGDEIGASLALTYRGKTVVDLWAGYADVEQTRPWQRDTIVFVASTTKIMPAICTLMLIDQGLIELDQRVARYWPEFAQGGKENVTVRDALSHRAGVPGFNSPVPADAMFDWLGFTSRIAAEPHWFGGERRLCYHLHTYGFILGELIRRVDGRQPAQFFREEIALKLGADFQIGLSRKVDLARMARPHDPTGRASFPEGSLMQRVWDSVGRADGGVGVYTSNWDFISADIPSGNGFGNGRSIAEVCAIVGAGGKLGDVRYLSENMIKEAGTEQVNEEDPFMGPMRYGLGFGLDSQYYQAPSPTSMHWGGYGGSWGLADFKARVSLGYTPNNFLTNLNGDPRHARFTAALKHLLPRL